MADSTALRMIPAHLTNNGEIFYNTHYHSITFQSRASPRTTLELRLQGLVKIIPRDRYHFQIAFASLPAPPIRIETAHINTPSSLHGTYGLATIDFGQIHSERPLHHAFYGIGRALGIIGIRNGCVKLLIVFNDDDSSPHHFISAWTPHTVVQLDQNMRRIVDAQTDLSAAFQLGRPNPNLPHHQ
ncbi:hypothetical protein ONZ45_g14101 [Pleurotus djamor]|nr:hypothetical protein ONZ45_g14101 [Pleurotus djamor]